MMHAQSSVINGNAIRLMAKDIGHFLPVEVIKKEALLLGMAQTLMENKLLAEKSMICMTSQPLIKRFRCLLM